MINKRKLIAKMSDKARLDEQSIEIFLKSFQDIIVTELKKDEKITIRGFGTFQLKNKPEKIWKNPYTKECIKLSAHKVIKWIPSKNLLK